MDFKLNFHPDEEYYKEAYDQLISIAKLKKFEPIFAVVFVLIGVCLYYFNMNKAFGFSSMIFSAIGIYEFFKFYYDRNKWLKDRNESKINGNKIELEFTDTHIKHSGPFSSGEINWSGLMSIIKTKKGIVIKPQNGLSIYLPDRLFVEQKQIDFILSKKK
ncbi:YcxB family protein [Flavobacterium sp. N2270]|uniref:YcxB family protein n=1 Tax=Flavobacterium sp. N2270 TaxID=2986831 RepID=UPI002224EBF3|nr:YcxB family protein [Flavobacterium sp. N2270]